MSGICGFTNNGFGVEKNADRIAQMATKLLVNASQTSQCKSTHAQSLAAAGLANEWAMAMTDDYIIAYQGNPYWQDGTLHKTAHEQGMIPTMFSRYRTSGEGFVAELSGHFSLCLMDVQNHQTLLAIDKSGICPLFYHVNDDNMVFSSNAKALRHYPELRLEIDPQSLFDYIYFHMIPSPRCIYQGVKKLQPGELLIVKKGQSYTKQYWQPTYHEEQHIGFSERKQLFFRLLESSVSRVAEDPNTGAFLSGGTDSSTISGMLRQIRRQPINTFSIGFDAKGFDEINYAKIASQHFNTIAHEYYLQPQNVADAIPVIAAAYDEPFGNASVIPAYYCAKLARVNGVTTLLAGDGGDEIFGGNERYAKQKIFEIYFSIPNALRKSLIEPLIGHFPYGSRFWPVAKLRNYIHQANVPLPDRLESYNFLNRMALSEIFNSDLLGQVDTGEPLNLLRTTYHNAAATSYINKMLHLDWKFTLADNDLRKVNRMCELADITVQYPLLDEELLNFAMGLPASQKVHGFQLRYFFKQALQGYLPKEILQKQKHGFGLPFGQWMLSSSGLKDLAHDGLVQLTDRGILNPSFTPSIMKNHQQYPNYYGVMIWVLMMLAQWLQNEEN